ncbi:insulin-like growth factor binding proteinn-terminal [Anaeramoeba flamelloides]|uniref:Insulin-like growth factor binding proteinn-terminal n=1 Tax=Anaeramoeba flamelloides TaxID=1746091 RepID=A0AAV7YJF1_9EUKA|nr:insulin-like growth factor binding proteinn-terminal [Anaeramoeba flamelloides]
MKVLIHQNKIQILFFLSFIVNFTIISSFESETCTQHYNTEKIGKEFLVNTLTDGDQMNSATTSIGSDNEKFVVVWEGNSGGVRKIYGQIFSSDDGSTVGSEFVVDSSQTLYDEKTPSVASIGSSNAKFVVVWEGNHEGLPRIYGQIYLSADGYNYGEKFRIDNSTVGEMSKPSVASIGASDEKFCVVWVSKTTASKYANYKINGQIFVGDGAKVEKEFGISWDTRNHTNPKISSIGTNKNKFVVVYQSFLNEGVGNSISAQIHNSLKGERLIDEFPVNSDNPSDLTLPSVSSISTDGENFVVAWQSVDSQGGQMSDIVAKIFTSDGALTVVDEFPVNNHTSDDQTNPSITSIGKSNEKFVICWSSNDQYADPMTGIYCQAFNSSNANTIANEFHVNNHTAEYQENPSIAFLDQQEPKFVVAWQSFNQEKNDTSYGVYSQIFNSIFVCRCAEGMYSNYSYSDECIKCPGGKFNLNTGSTSSADCKDCPIGKYNNQSGQSECSFCQMGTYNEVEGATICSLCKKGTYNPNTGSTSITDCIDCPKGEYNDQSGQSGCSECQIGRYNGAEGVTICPKCEPGTFSNETGLSVCNSCSKGKYTDQSGQSGCLECQRGRYNEVEGATICSLCPQGTYNPDTGSISIEDCMVCPKGEYNDQLGQSGCLLCEKGRYNEAEGAKNCPKCEPGSFSNETGLSVCTSCSKGKYNDQSGQRECLFCQAGRYNDLEGAKKCSLCPEGTSNPNTGSTSIANCMECPIGKYNDQSGQRECKLCQRGTYSNQYGQSKCSSCMSGTFQDLTGGSGCHACDLGSFQNLTGAQNCQKCPTGTYANEKGLTLCQNCPLGGYNPSTGSISKNDCVPCEIGEYSDQEGSSSCKLCNQGRYNDQRNSISCQDCPTGSYSDREGQTFCKSCQAGKYQDKRGTVVCRACPFNTWQSMTGSSQCNYCPMNSETLSTKSISIRECYCSIGYIGKPGSYCAKCPDNSICNQFNQQYPKPKKGYWSSSEDPNHIVKCSIDNACPGNEIGKCNKTLGYDGFQCEECLVGFYKFEDQCEKCPENNFIRLFAYALLLILVIIIFLFVAIKSKNYFGSLSIFINFFQIIAILPHMNLNWPIKLVNFFQLCSLFNFNIDFLALECNFNFNYFQKWLLIMLLPFVLILILLIIYLLLFAHSIFVKLIGSRILNNFPSLCVKPNKREHNKFLLPFSSLRFFIMKFFLQGWSKLKLKFFVNISINVFVASLLILYLVLCLKILEFFNCQYSSINSKYIFQPDHNYYCFDEWWFQTLPYVILFGILYIIGIPIFFGLILLYNSKRVNEKIFNQRLSLLNSRYKREFFYWEFIIIFRKFFIVIFEIYLHNYPYLQIFLLIVLILVSIIIQVLYTPYNTNSRNFYELSLLTIMLLIFFFSLIFLSNGNQQNAKLFDQLSNFIIILFLVVLGILLIISFFEIKSRIRHNKKKSKIKKINNLTNSSYSKQNEPIIKFLKSTPNILLLLNFFSTINNSKNKKLNKLLIKIFSNYLSNKKINKKTNNDQDREEVDVDELIKNIWTKDLSILLLMWYHKKASFIWKLRFSTIWFQFLNYYMTNFVDNAEEKVEIL